MGLFFKSQKQREQEKRLIAMQNYLYAVNSPTLIRTQKDILRSAASFIKERRDKLIREKKKADTAKDPKKFFDSVEIINECMSELEFLNGLSPGIVASFDEVRNELQNSLCNDIDLMIDKTWENYRYQALKLTKETSKENKIHTFFDVMDLFKNRMYPQNLEHLERLRSEYYSKDI